jgi:hypothetical protein
MAAHHREDTRHLQVDDAVPDLDGWLDHGVGGACRRAWCIARKRLPMITNRRRRFLAQAGLVARIYARYKWLQVRGRAGGQVSAADWHRAHRLGADLT